MVRSLIKSLFLYSTLAASVVLGAPAHHHSGSDADEPISIHAFQRSGQDTAAVQRGVTNAMRLANGLPPLAPRKLYNGSKAGSAHKPRTSAPPPITGTGILVYDSNGLSGSLLGYVGASLNVYSTYQVVTRCKDAMTSPTLSSSTLTNPRNSFYPVIAFASSSSTFSTGDSSSGDMVARDTASITSGPVPQGMKWWESNVWSLGANNELIMKWVNPDGSAVTQELLYLSSFGNGIKMTGSVSAFKGISNYNQAARQIRLFLADQPLCPPVLPV